MELAARQLTKRNGYLTPKISYQCVTGTGFAYHRKRAEETNLGIHYSLVTLPPPPPVEGL
jgi:hypothetical protein